MTDSDLTQLRLGPLPHRRMEPAAPIIPVRPAAVPSAEPTTHSPIFSADGLDGQDALGIDTLVSTLSEFAVHKRVEMPACIGLLGAPGTGKSFALARLGAAVSALTASVANEKDTPFLSRVSIVKADAAHLDGEPMAAIAGALCAGLGETAPDLVDEALRAVRDPQAAVAETAERLDQAQRRLLTERDSLIEVEGRRARLFETLLYETPGSQVDAYARTYRGRIASQLQAFGFSGDPIVDYKDLVATLAAARGPGRRISIALRSLWAFKGQTRLLMIAAAFILASWGLGWAVEHRTIWLEPLRANQTGGPIAAWFDLHMAAMSSLAQAAVLVAGLAIAANLWRAFRFLQPVLRGVTLLQAELANRGGELDNAFAHQTRRVDGLAAEVERAARAHAEADKQAGQAASQGTAFKETSPFRRGGEKAQALAFVKTIASRISSKRQGTEPSGKQPRRIVFMLDNLDAVHPARACEILDAAHRLLANPAFVMVIAADPKRLVNAGPSVETYLEKWVQVPVRIDAITKDHAGFIAHLVGPDGRGELAKTPHVPALAGTRHSRLDQPLSDAEASLLTELAPLAGRSPRSLKRFVNLYRLTRPFAAEHWASLAFMLALQSGGTAAEIEAVANALAVAKPGADFELPYVHPRLADLLAVVGQVESRPTAEAAKHAAQIATAFSFKG